MKERPGKLGPKFTGGFKWSFRASPYLLGKNIIFSSQASSLTMVLMFVKRSVADARLAWKVPSGDKHVTTIHQQPVLMAASLVAWHGHLPPRSLELAALLHSQGTLPHGDTPARRAEPTWLPEGRMVKWVIDGSKEPRGVYTS